MRKSCIRDLGFKTDSPSAWFHKNPRTKSPRTLTRTRRRFVLTHIREVVHEDDLLEEVLRRAVDHRVHSPQEDRPGLVVEADDDRGVGQLGAVLVLPTSAEEETTRLVGVEESFGSVEESEVESGLWSLLVCWAGYHGGLGAGVSMR